MEPATIIGIFIIVFVTLIFVWMGVSKKKEVDTAEGYGTREEWEQKLEADRAKYGYTD